jgi:hypothetical protein
MMFRGESFPQRLAQKWFAEARRWYVEEHQGCPRCQGRHCVFRARWGSRVEYHCTACDFSAAHDEAQGAYAATVGESMPTGVPLLADAVSVPAPRL